MLVFNVALAKEFYTRLFPIDNPLHAKEFCVLPSHSLDGLFDF